VFRAADSRNYYACKLLESKRGTGAVFSIVRYAMVDGHERLRIQLPLPVTATARSMFRVRQEIRGDQFTTYLDGRVIDTWSDASLPTGGFGFFADPGRNRLHSLGGSGLPGRYRRSHMRLSRSRKA
jgi:hypothetical protein